MFKGEFIMILASLFQQKVDDNLSEILIVHQTAPYVSIFMQRFCKKSNLPKLSIFSCLIYCEM